MAWNRNPGLVPLSGVSETDPENKPADPQRADSVPVTPVDSASVCQALERMDLRYQVREYSGNPHMDLVLTGFVDAAISFLCIDGELRCEARWRGEVPDAQAARVLETTRTLNEANFIPALFVTEGFEANTLAVVARARMPIATGLTTEQLDNFLVFYLRQTVSAFATLARVFPESVDWQDPHA